MFLMLSFNAHGRIILTDEKIKSRLDTKISYNFELSNKKIPIMRAIINDEVVLCAIDTGQSFSLLTSDRIARKLKINNISPIDFTYNGKKIKAKKSLIENFALADFSINRKVTFGKTNILIVNDTGPIFTEHKCKGMDVDVVFSLNSQIGISIMQIDYIDKKINLKNTPATVDYSNAKKVPVKMVDNLPYLQIERTSGEKYEILLDTGCAYILLSDKIAYGEDVKSKGKIFELIFIDEVIDTRQMMLKKFSIGELDFFDLKILSFESPQDMLWGYEGMKDYVVTIDISKGYVYFEK